MYFNEATMVETVSRHPKPILAVAENLSVVTAAQIKAMNAHTLYEVLNRVPGLYLAFIGGDFGSQASVTIHGTDFNDEHRLVVLLDGVRLNNANNGIAMLNGIPVAIIDRLEIIKGPASSVWGSSIGGVVNIITKKPLDSPQPTGQIAASYGTADSRDLRAEVEGGYAGQKYYLYAGNQHSDGLRDKRYFDNSQVFGKAVFAPSTDTRFTLSGGASHPEWKEGDFVVTDFRGTADTENGFTAANFDYTLSSAASLHLEGSFTTFDHTQKETVLGTGMLGIAGDPILLQNWREQRVGLGGRLVYAPLDRQVLVIGSEVWREQLDYDLTGGPASAMLYGTMLTDYRADQQESDSFALYATDTLRLADLSLIPGIRYDHSSFSGGFVSPSFGATYPVFTDTRLRATLARGFSAPYLAQLKEVTPFSVANPDLKPEEIYSAQSGFETKAIPLLLLKTTAFYHDIDEVWGFDAMGKIINQGHSRRNGVEIEVETIPWQHLVFGGAFTYTKDHPQAGEDGDFSQGSVKVSYSNPALVDAQLFGSYVHWLESATYLGEGDNFVWDLNVSKNVAMQANTNVDVFMTLHNLTDVGQYWHAYYQNPGRWLEVGLRFHF